MNHVARAAALGTAILIVALQLPAVVVATQLPRDVARQAFAAFWVGALAQYAVCGALLGAALGALAGRALGGDPLERRWLRFLFPHLLLTTLVALSAVLGDRDAMNWLLVGGVASVLSLLLLLPRTWGVRAAWALAAVLSVVPWLVVQRSTPVSRPETLAAPDGLRPDLALVVLDTVRRDRLALYGDLDGGDLATPALSALARDGLRLDAAFSASPWSAPSHATLFTGKVPSRHGMTADTLHLDAGQLTLAELLRRHGYLTAGLSGNPWVSDATGLTRGFHLWVDRGGEAGIASHFLLAKILDATALVGGRDKGGRAIVRALGEVLGDADGAHPRFVFVNLSEPHAPYWRIPAAARRAHDANTWAAQRASLRTLEAQHHGVTPAPSQREAALRSYDAAIAYADELLGELRDGLEREGRDLCLVVVSDHGEMFGEHGVWGHGHGLYRPLLEVPAVVHCPGRVPAGAIFDETVSLADVAPTLAGVGGVDAAPLEADGVDLTPWFAGEAAGAPHPHGVFAEHEIPEYLSRALDLQGRDAEAAALRVRRRAVIQGPWRHELTLGEDGSRGEHLFQLDEDPGEARDLASDPGAVWARAEAQLRMEWWTDHAVGPWGATPAHRPADLPADTELQLRSLGYLD